MLRHAARAPATQHPLSETGVESAPVHEAAPARLDLPILTWGGLRGGISVAQALGLPDDAIRPVLLPVCYGVAVFTIVVQGLTIKRLARVLYPSARS